jgi:hypothetical protein
MVSQLTRELSWLYAGRVMLSSVTPDLECAA